MIKINIQKYEFIDAFKCRKDNFSAQGLSALYDYLCEFERDTGVPYELDVIALCCSFREYQDIAEFIDGHTLSDVKTIDDIAEYTTVIPIDDQKFIAHVF